MQVIGAGFGRTGTTSMKAALERLGFGPCYHMIEVMQNPEHARLWKAAYDGEITNWDDLLGGYESTTDWPGCTYWRELMAAYPDAKVLLNVRDPERWYDSIEKTILYPMRAGREAMEQAETEGVPAPDHGPPPEMLRNVLGPIVHGTFHDRMDERAYAIEIFERHNQEVREGVPADRLLEYEVKQGWAPLCEFLGVPVPDEEFPHLNDGETFAQRIEEHKERLREQASEQGEQAGGVA